MFSTKSKEKYANMKKLFKEFKDFITRGNVLDLAVGMIIGAAFTAIVTALVNGIFKPLINAIPMGEIEGLITMLVAKDVNGELVKDTGLAIDLTQSVYINWGDFIMAIINFLLTAVILFAIIKTINTVRKGMEEGLKTPNLTKEEKAQLKAQGMTRKQMKEYAEKRDAEASAKKAAEEAAAKPETSDRILKDIRELLRAQSGVAVPEASQTAEPENN